MKKLFLMVLCFFLVAASAQAGAGGNSGKQENPRQAGKSSIYFYDVECKSVGDNNGYGRLVINTEKKTFMFIGQDFTPMQHVHIKVTTGNHVEILAQGKSTKTGNLHIQGQWEGTFLPIEGSVAAYYYYDPAFGFELTNVGGYVCHIKIRWSEDGGGTWHTTEKQTDGVSLGETYRMHIDNLEDDTHIIPENALVKMKLVIVGGDDVWTDETYTRVHGYPPGYCFPYYTSRGTTWNALFDYDSNQCTADLNSDYWWLW